MIVVKIETWQIGVIVVSCWLIFYYHFKRKRISQIFIDIHRIIYA